MSDLHTAPTLREKTDDPKLEWSQPMLSNLGTNGSVANADGVGGDGTEVPTS